MKKKDYRELQHLWDGSDDWVLVQTECDHSGEEPAYIIQNQRTGRVMLMGDPTLAEEATALMLAANVNVLSNSKQ